MHNKNKKPIVLLDNNSQLTYIVEVTLFDPSVILTNINNSSCKKLSKKPVTNGAKLPS